MSAFTINLSARFLTALAIACIVTVNGFILTKVYLNRSEVKLQLTLSERELHLPPNYGFNKEDSSARLNINWNTPFTKPITTQTDHWDWENNRYLSLSDKHYASFNFLPCEKKHRLTHKQQAWVLLEFNGASYSDYIVQAKQYHELIHSLKPATNTAFSENELNEKRKQASDLYTKAQNSVSRLFVIDAATKRELLISAQNQRQASDEGHLFIVPAELHAGFYRCNKDDTQRKENEVRIESLAIESLFIPKSFAKPILAEKDASSKLHFAVDIAYGRFYEPWVRDVRYCSNKCS
ncbi:MAG: DUF4824 family protein [Moraxellaceae bacterium]|nr:MAG: DUF4824 family protein [Moraxellaceae bacterium]